MKRPLLFLLFFLIFLLHLFAALHLSYKNPGFFFHNDGDEYYSLGISFTENGRLLAPPGGRYYECPNAKLRPEAHRIQIYSVLHGILIRIFSDPLFAAAFLTALLSAVLAFQFFELGIRLTGKESTGWIALLLAEADPLLQQYSLQFCTETPFTCALLLFIRVLLTEESLKKYVLAGLSAALICLIRPTGGAVLALALPVILIREMFSGKFRTGLRKAALMFLTAAVLLFPLGLRNCHYFGTFNVTGYLGGFNLFLGYHPENAKAYFSSSGKEFLRHQENAWKDALRTAQNLNEPNPAQQSRILSEMAWENAKELGPVKVLSLLFAKAWQFIRPWPMPGVHPLWKFLGIAGYEIMISLFGWMGLWHVRRHPELYLPFLTVLSAGWGAHALVHVYMRHRVPFADPVLICFSGVALTELLLPYLKRFFFCRKKKGLDQ